ncbi:unnamed protein product [Didymodactylos carnosus]|uniref:2-amino-3-carboxymuconate-6-semialdehyde decarboxylase n=1 Tax=Didymodactylos carnosus TaxID=1234261 RepID=A0A814TF08_9BILA|nr:unnamed protein product [Didymodactylos carnosus]CAF1160545.1 unnamed protein product [Didymodactylos carnosus]CAF3726196.1 unnamed protein product [Didymodactylos carnosus]CAF3924084.1 unnamed protein product [Didymodactylos carnosus]
MDSNINKNARRIDIHHHIVPDFYAKAIEENGAYSNKWPVPTWSVEQAKEHMSILGIETAIVSVPTPGAKIYEDNKEKRRILVRKLNEFMGDLVKNNPKEFGFFASLPSLTDVEGTLNEINYVHSTLKPDGYLLFTSYGNGQYLGHPSFKAIWTKLNELKAAVFIHPCEASTTVAIEYLPPPLLDFPHETTRTASDIVLSGTRAACPDIKIILSHAGGTLPFLARRITMAGAIPSLHCPRQPEQILSDFRSFYYDTALSSSVPQLQALLHFADPSKIIFGSDIPYAPLSVTLDYSKSLDTFFLNQFQNFSQAINRENAKKLFPDKFTD